MDEEDNEDECHSCQGMGYWTFRPVDPEDNYEKETCDVCKGLGYLRSNSVNFINEE